ncbi:helix-turn-helix domain-containing protein [Virgibacillus sp. 179-BFC.A HS]|uniref:Helix-turn-helix domain-containing protein n=1 Tax=Tigheibacillus jepli TaxID=3035914 RepID=A0ABU5CIT8_9BACI|nr:helix-turn-helix domain-containing protein [Virgibacillus sp. 179-BFC.A HS]MDY0406264.1 helix-turn-helix domain-containing protein [Virgibacillus sp. 179-BFC.A HS]
MLEQLKKHFSSFILLNDCAFKDIHLYEWFITADQQKFGILKSELTQRDVSLLHAFVQPYQAELPEQTPREKFWWELVSSNKPFKEMVTLPYRFVYFSMQKQQIDPDSFKEAIHAVLAKKISILWLHPNEGILVEEGNDEIDDGLSYNQIIDTLMSDLYVNIKFLTGPFLSDLSAVGNYFKLMITNARKAFQMTDKNVLSFVDGMILSMVAQTDMNGRDISTSILKEFANDHDFLHTLTVFFQCNLNLSETAKALYMHRNSLQYRLDKFKQKTGLDVRDFHQAMTAYIAILLKHAD